MSKAIAEVTETEEPTGQNQKALMNIRLVRSLNDCPGWHGLMKPHIEGLAAKAAEDILENDALTNEERERKRQYRKELLKLLRYPEETEGAAVKVMDMARLPRAAQLGNG